MRTLLPLLCILACSSAPQKPAAAPASAEELELHQKAIVLDTHSDITEAIFYEGYDFNARHTDRHLDLPRMREGGLDGEFFSIFVHPESVDIHQFFPEAMKQIDALEAVAGKSSGKLAVAKTAAEVRKNAEAGVTSMLLGLEGGHMLLPGSEDEQIVHLKRFAARGVKYMTLSWSSSSPIGGSTAEAEQEGLTPFGKRVIKEMEGAGVIVDLSHGSDPLFWDVVRIAKKPVMLTHSAARALANHPRNASDAMIEAVARTGGVVCVNFSRTFLDDAFRKKAQGLLQKTKAMHNSEKIQLYAAQKPPLPDVPLSRLIDHLEHVAKVGGPGTACLGSDFDGVPMTPNGLEDVSKLAAITVELKRRGWSDENVKKVLGENVLRVLASSQGG